jgi:hypothetical protein
MDITIDAPVEFHFDDAQPVRADSRSRHVHANLELRVSGKHFLVLEVLLGIPHLEARGEVSK